MTEEAEKILKELRLGFTVYFRANAYQSRRCRGSLLNGLYPVGIPYDADFSIRPWYDEEDREMIHESTSVKFTYPEELVRLCKTM